MNSKGPLYYIFIMVASGLGMLFLAWLGRRASFGTEGGWKRLTPSPMHWFIVGLGGALLLMFLWIGFFVGSSRPDAEQQMVWLVLLIIAFGASVAYAVVAIIRLRKLAFEWDGTSIAWRGRSGEGIVRHFGELVSISRTGLGSFVLAFDDGTIVKVDEHARGVSEFLQTLAEKRADLLH